MGLFRRGISIAGSADFSDILDAVGRGRRCAFELRRVADATRQPSTVARQYLRGAGLIYDYHAHDVRWR